MNPTIVTEPTFEAADRRLRFIAQHIHELLRDYPEQYVAIGDAGVVVSAPDLDGIIRAVKEAGLSTRRDVTVQFITHDMARLLL